MIVNVLYETRLENARELEHLNYLDTDYTDRTEVRGSNSRDSHPCQSARSARSVFPFRFQCHSTLSSKSPVSTRLPGLTNTSATFPCTSLASVVSIFIASSVNSFCPFETLSPAF